MVPSNSLESHGITAGSTITTVHRVLVPEGQQDRAKAENKESWDCFCLAQQEPKPMAII